MSKFITKLDMELILDASGMPLANRSGRQLYRLLADLAYQSNVAAMLIVAKTGFITDLESCPRVPFIYDSVGEIVQMPAVIHDNLYTFHQTTKDIADKVLREAAILQGVSHWKAEAIYLGVDYFGRSAWDKH